MGGNFWISTENAREYQASDEAGFHSVDITLPADVTEASKTRCPLFLRKRGIVLEYEQIRSITAAPEKRLALFREHLAASTRYDVCVVLDLDGLVTLRKRSRLQWIATGDPTPNFLPQTKRN
eukprot:2849218-Amphidinium_carterae.1